jgi:hypothetical protein
VLRLFAVSDSAMSNNRRVQVFMLWEDHRVPGRSMTDGLIDTGQQIEVYCDGLGSIEIHGTTVCFNGFRLKGDPPERVVNLTVIVPLSAVPDIATQIAGTFATFLNQRVRDVLTNGVH